MCQLQKLYAKWLTINLIPAINPIISEHQAGYRRGRQASEVLFTVQKMIEISHEWQQPLVLLKIDIRKAFDTIRQSSILQALEGANLHPMLTMNIARELVGNYLRPQLYGCGSEEAIPQKRGTKQGSPESGLLFIHTINHAMQPMKSKWDQDMEGFPLSDGTLNHLIFVDDLILAGTSHCMVARMLSDATQALTSIGLQINPDKTSYLTTTPTAKPELPGTNANQDGLKILGRIFTLQDSTPADMSKKIATAWGKFNRLRHVLGANTPLPHRIRIFKACVGQALLWAAETWHVTRRRLQKIRGVELQMMKTLIKRPYLPQDISDSEKHEQHKTHIRQTLQEHKYIGLDRVWLKKYYGWAGHLARLADQRVAKRAMRTQNMSWWKAQQANPEGYRHVWRAGNLSRWEGALCRHHPRHDKWWEAAKDRTQWQKDFQEFERRVFGPNCPHVFDPPPKPDTETEQGTSHSPPARAAGHPRRGQGTRTTNTQQAPGRESTSTSKRARTPRNLSREGHRNNPKCRKHPEQEAKKSQQPQTQAQIAAAWQKALDAPLITLAHQDVSAYGSRLQPCRASQKSEKRTQPEQAHNPGNGSSFDDPSTSQKPSQRVSGRAVSGSAAASAAAASGTQAANEPHRHGPGRPYSEEPRTRTSSTRAGCSSHADGKASADLEKATRGSKELQAAWERRHHRHHGQPRRMGEAAAAAATAEADTVANDTEANKEQRTRQRQEQDSDGKRQGGEASQHQAEQGRQDVRQELLHPTALPDDERRQHDARHDVRC